MSTIKVDNLQTTSGAGQYTAKTWAHFTAYSSFSLQGSGNVSSVTDNSTGNFRVNFSTALSASNYAGIATAGNDATSYADGNQNTDHVAMMGQMNTNNVYVASVDADDGAPDDPQYMGVIIVI